jgi:hypothetical protein
MFALSPVGTSITPLPQVSSPAPESTAASASSPQFSPSIATTRSLRFSRVQSPRPTASIGRQRSTVEAPDAVSDIPFEFSDDLFPAHPIRHAGHDAHSSGQRVSEKKEMKGSITHREAKQALRHYFKATRQSPRHPERRNLFSNPGRMIAYLYDDFHRHPTASSASAPSDAWVARKCDNTEKLDLLLSKAGIEKPDAESRMPILRGLLQRFIELPRERESFSIAGYDFLAAARVRKSAATIRDEFKEHLQASFRTLRKKPDAAHWLACQLLERFDPSLLRADLEHLWYGGGQFTVHQAAVHVLISANLYRPGLGLREINDAAIAVRDTLSDQDILRREMYIPQSDPALLHAHTEHIIDLRLQADPVDAAAYRAAVRALNDLQTAARRRQFAPLKNALANLKIPPPTRREIAEQCLRERGADPSVEGAAQWEVDSCIGQTKTLLQFYLDGCEGTARELLPPGSSEELPDLDQAYDEAFEAWFGKYERSLAVLLHYAVEELRPSDYLFWRNNPVELLQATMTATKLIAHVSPTFQGNPTNTKVVTLAGNSSLLFSAEHGDERRYYQISLGNRNTAIVRRIWPGESDIETYIHERPEHFFDATALKETTYMAVSTTTGVQQLAAFPAGEPTLRFTETAAQLASFVRQEIHDFGYQRTGHRQTVEQIEEFLFGLIPGYDCVSALSEGRYKEAVEPCVMDVHSIALPVAARLGKAVRAMAQLAPRALSVAATREIGEILAKQGSWKAALAVAGRMQQPVMNAGKDFAYGLGKDLLRIGDPGFEMTYQLYGQARKFSSLAKRIFDDAHLAAKLHRLLHRNPHTQHTAAIVQQERRRIRLNHTHPPHPSHRSHHSAAQKSIGNVALPTRYEGTLSSDSANQFFSFDLPSGAKVQFLPYLKHQAPYSELDETIALYDINGIVFARDPRTPGTLLNADILLSELANCRATRGADGAACIVVEQLAGNHLTSGKGYRFSFGRNKRQIFQYHPATQQKNFAVPILEAHPVPVDIGSTPRRIILTPDDAYELGLTQRGLLKAKIIGYRYNQFALEGPDTLLPTSGRLVSRTDANGEQLTAVELMLENGAVECKIRAHYGTYLDSDEHGNRIYRGMIQLGQSHIRVDFHGGDTRTGQVSLAEADAAEIAAYRRFQTEQLVEHERRASDRYFPMELSHSSAGRLLRLYRHYDLTPYRRLLGKIASLPGHDSARAAEALDAYIENPERTAEISAFGEIKSHFDRLLHDQFHSYDSVRRFEQHLTAAINEHTDGLDIHVLDMASPRVDETLETLAALFPDMKAAQRKYRETLAKQTELGAESIRALTVAHMRRSLHGRNIAYAQVYVLENGVPALEKTYFSVSGKQQANDKRASLRIATIEPDEKHVDADQVFSNAEKSPPPQSWKNPGDRAPHRSRKNPGNSAPSQSLMDIGTNGNAMYRGHDSELKILMAYRLDFPADDSHRIMKMVTLLPPCVICRQELGMASREYPNTEFDVVHIKASRYDPQVENAAAADADAAAD